VRPDATDVHGGGVEASDVGQQLVLGAVLLEVHEQWAVAAERRYLPEASRRRAS